MTEEQLIATRSGIAAACAGILDSAVQDKRSRCTRSSFRRRIAKSRVGGKPLRAVTLEPAGEIVASRRRSNRLQLKVGPRRTVLEYALSLIPEPPLRQGTCASHLSICVNHHRRPSEPYAAVSSCCSRQLPGAGFGTCSGDPLLAPMRMRFVVASMSSRAWIIADVLIQGPPGRQTYCVRRRPSWISCRMAGVWHCVDSHSPSTICWMNRRQRRGPESFRGSILVRRTIKPMRRHDDLNAVRQRPSRCRSTTWCRDGSGCLRARFDPDLDPHRFHR